MIYVTNNNIGQTGGGDAVVAMEIIESLHSHGLDVGSISRGYKIPEYLKGSLSGLKNFDLPFIPEMKKYSRNRSGTLRFLAKKTESMVKRYMLDMKLRKRPPKLLITNDLLTGDYVQNYFTGDYKTIHVVHNMPSFYEDLKGEDLEDYFDLYNASDHVVFVSEENRRIWLSYKKLDEQKTSFVYNCANEVFAKRILKDSKKSVREKLKMRSDKFYLVTVASFHPQKGLDFLIEAAPELKRIAPNLEILVIGAKREAYKEFMQGKLEEKAVDCFKMLGFKDNAMEYIYAADAFILPSRVEGFPLVVLEAMILNTPVLTSRVGGIPEMINHDKTGLLFESEDVKGIIECFDKMYNDANSRKKYAEYASERYWSTFSKYNFSQKYISIVNKLMA